ncbi:MAG: FHA domain-containing protein, partial [Planctomycetota bacterium]
MSKLVVEEGDSRREVPIDDEPVVIGRDLGNAVVIRDSMSSRRHCQVRRDGERFVLEDLKSSNGTVLNGVTTPTAALRDGDVIQIGEVKLTFVESGVAEPSTPPAAPADEARAEAVTVVPPSESGGSVKIEVVEGPGAGTDATIEEVPFIIGRRPDCDFQIPDRRVSSRHAEIRRDGGQWTLVDLESGNGTYVGKRRVKRHVLLNNQILVLGGDTKVRFQGLPEVATAIADAPRAKAARPVKVKDPFAGEFAEATRRVDVERAGASASPLQAIFTAVFFLSFLVILYYGYSFVTDFLRSYKPPEIAGNLLSNANWSFENVSESGEVPGWTVDSRGGNAEISASRDGVPHGQAALSATAMGKPASGFVRILCDEIVPVADGSVMELSGKLKNEGFRAAGFQLLWLLRADSGYRVVDESVTQLVSGGTSFSNLNRQLHARPFSGAEACQVAIVGWGRGGSLSADEVVLRKVEDPAPEAMAIELPSTIAKDRDLRFTFHD